jgi:S-DNA-T family DNA segregation ATPase FtsK/SpoIIIE
MATKKKTTRRGTPTFNPKDARPKWVAGILAFIASALTALALFDYHWTQVPPIDFSSEMATEINLVGRLGVYIGYYSIQVLGKASFVIPLICLWFTYILLRPKPHLLKLRKYMSLIILIISLAVFQTMIQSEVALSLEEGKIDLSGFAENDYPQGWGGWIGQLIYGEYLRMFLGMVGSLVVFGILSLFSLGFILHDNVIEDVRLFILRRIKNWKEGAPERARKREEAREKKVLEKESKERLKKLAQKTEAAKQAAKKESEAEKNKEAKEAAPPPGIKKGFKIGKKGPDPEQPSPFSPIVDEVAEDVPRGLKELASDPMIEGPPPDDGAPMSAASGKLKLGADKPKPVGRDGLTIIASEKTRKADFTLPESRGDYHFPGPNLLTEPVETSREDDASVHQATADSLIQILEEFGVKVTPGEVHAGPVITRYDVYPAAGVRVEKILNLDKNIALGLKALSVRILAPVPGKGCVGIEVPNKNPQSVYIRDILESEDWVKNKAEIPIALGKEVSGKPLIADLTKMPHLLIAGSTGSGKTVCINSIITSLLYHSSPNDLQFVMVDPKIVEMQVYNKLPHMMVPVVTDPKKVPNALSYLLKKMEERYQIFAQIGVRNIAGYNAKMAKDRNEQKDAEELAAELDAALTPEERAASANVEVPRDPELGFELPEKLPYIVCIVDELADLMMVAPADIETGIARLAQLARAAGIHLILATQRPSVNVITGVIKANLPSRIAFKVASKVDSRTILDTQGADHLIGKGDMLFLPPGSADLVRSQGAFVADDEITGIVDYIAEKNGEPDYDELFQSNIEKGDEDEDSAVEGDWDDDMVPKAIEVIRTSKRASTSMLQRRLKIGYNRAARIMEQLEEEGLVGPENGSSPREILMDLD